MSLRVAVVVLLLLFLAAFTVGAALDDRGRRAAPAAPATETGCAEPVFDGYDCPLQLLVIREVLVTGLAAQPFVVPEYPIPPDANARQPELPLPPRWTDASNRQLSQKEAVI